MQEHPQEHQHGEAPDTGTHAPAQAAATTDSNAQAFDPPQPSRRRWLSPLGNRTRPLLTTRPLLSRGRRRNESAALQAVGEEEEEPAQAGDPVAEAAKWARRRDIPVAILAWAGVVYLILLIAQHVVKTLLMVIIAALLAFALAPAVTWLERFVPRVLAILFVYLIALVGLFALFYMIVISAIDQVNAIAIFLSHQNWSTWLALLQPLGITAADVQKQISALQGQLLNTARDAAGSVVPLLTGVADALLNVVIVAVLSIYFLIDGQRVTAWLRRNAPVSLRRQTRFTLDTLNRVVGGYIRGQLLLCALIGVLVGAGMAIFHVPYALLLGVLAFLLEFIPILGTLVSGAICVLLALTQGWFIAVLVLAYFIGVHILEGDIIGPRLVGKAIGLHPIVSIAALIAGAELFGIWGALFASPVAGLLQALLVALWLEWRARQPHEFATAKVQAVDAALETTAHPTAPEPEGTHASD